MPTVVTLLSNRHEIQAAERAAAPHWQTRTYEGEEINLVFITPSGRLVLRQTIAKLVKQAATTPGVDADIGTHEGGHSPLREAFQTLRPASVCSLPPRPTTHRRRAFRSVSA